MRLAVVGVGGAGSRVVNRLLAVEAASGRTLSNGNALLVTSREPAFDTAERVPTDRRLTVGDVHEAVDGGTDGDPDLGAEIARQERGGIVRAFDAIDLHRVDGVLVVAGLAGGTGGGAGAVVVDQLQAVCDEPVYAVGILPAESEGRRAALTAARSLQSFVDRADNVVAFDNDAWLADDGSADAGSADASDGAFRRANAALAERLVTVFAAGEFDDGATPENRLDPSDIARTLDTGGVSTIGYASTEVPRAGGVRSWIDAVWRRLPGVADRVADEEPTTDAAKVDRLVRRAARSELTLPCAVSSADRALVLLSGPPRALSRKGFESGRYWVEEEADVVDVRAGDEPHGGSNSLTVTVVFSNVTDVPRIDAMQEQALDHDGTSGDGHEGADGDEGWECFEAANTQ